MELNESPSFQPCFITLEGGEGAGKSTQIKLLQDRLTALGIPVYITREPGGAPGSEEIRRLLVEGEPGRWQPMCEVLLITAARAEHVEVTVKPYLQKGYIVISDRFYDSSVAYQGAGLGLGMEKVRDIQKLALGDFEPDLTLILDLPVEIGLGRAVEREGKSLTPEDRYERMGAAFHERLRGAFLHIAKTEGRCRVINADASVEKITEDLWQHVSVFIGLSEASSERP